MTALPPGPVAAPRRRHAGFVLFCIAAFGLQLWISAPDEVVASPNPYDQLRYAEMAEELLAGHWLGPYGPLTLVRAPGYPMWVALVAESGVPLRAAAEWLLAATAFGFALTLLRVGVSAAAAAAAFGVLVLEPHAFLVDRELLPAGFYLPVLLVLLAGLILAVRARRPGARAVHAAWAGLAAGLLWVTRPESFLIPGLVACAAGVELWVRRGEAERSWRDALLLVGCAAAGAGAVVGGVVAANYRHYGVAVVSEARSPGYLAAQRALLSVEQARPRRLVPLPAEVRARIYAVSPSFRRLEPWLEGPSWGRSVSCAQLNVCDDLGGSVFAWTLREAALASEGARGAPALDACFRRIASEVRAACRTGALTCREPRFAFLHPYPGTWLPHLGQSLRALVARIATAGNRRDRRPPRDDTTLPEPLRRRFDALAQRRQELTSERWFDVAGFAASDTPLSSVSLRAGPDAPAQPVGVAGDGGAGRIEFAFRWERVEAPPTRPRLEIARRAGAPVEVALDAVARAPVEREGVEVAIGTLRPLQVDPEAQRRVRGALWSLHALWVRAAGIAGLAAGLLCLTRFGRPRCSAAFWVAVATLAVAVVSRLLLLVAVDASSFPAATSRYLYPLIPLYSCLMLLLMDAALAGRLRRRAP